MRLFFALAIFGAACLSARADSLDLFSYRGIDSFGLQQTVSFTLPASPTVDSSLSGLRFFLNPTPVTIDGVTYSDVSLSFGSSVPTFGGVTGTENPYSSIGFTLNTPALFTGSTEDPTFALGTYAVSSAEVNGVSLFGPAAQPGALTISAYSPSSVTPEPSSMVLLGTGLLALGGLAVRRKAYL